MRFQCYNVGVASGISGQHGDIYLWVMYGGNIHPAQDSRCWTVGMEFLHSYLSIMNALPRMTIHPLQ